MQTGTDPAYEIKIFRQEALGEMIAQIKIAGLKGTRIKLGS